MNPVELENKFGAHNYHPLPVMITRGSGIHVWDENNKQYMDMMSAYSAISHGHCHPKLVKALTEQAKTIAVVSRAFYSNKLGAFLQKACELTGMARALPMNSGAEAVETALKAARKWAYTVKKVPANQAEIIACTNNFHGRTISIVSMSTEPQYKDGFGPLVPGFKIIPYGDSAALEKAITPNTAAFIVEPIQGEAGIIVPPKGYLKVLLITDEIQTGLGRTGKILASQHENVKPDCITLGKALGGGLMPVSLFLAREDVMNVFTPGDHGSTFGGSPLAAAVGLEALNVLVDEKLAENAAELGEYFMSELKKINSPLVKDIRGKGLLIGIEIDVQKKSARNICLELLKLGLLSKETHHTVIRLAPPLVITKSQIDEAVNLIKQVL
jgi:ornithine--oxo-acid transaminase